MFYFGERNSTMRLALKTTFLFLLTVCAASSPTTRVIAATYVVGPEDNSVYLDQREPDGNFVSGRGLLVASESNENARTVIHFDLEGWSADSISQAKLCLYRYRGGYYSISRTINVYPLTSAFDESTATWNYPWTSSGGDFDNGITASAEVPELPNEVAALVEWDVTDMVKNRWSNIADCGFMVKDWVEDTPTDGPYVRFRSHRYVNDAPLELPYLEISTGQTGVEEAGEDEIGGGFSLGQNFPNPFNDRTVLQFELSKPARVNLVIYNLRGQKVKTLLDATREAGRYALEWDGTNQAGGSVSSGLYLYRMRTAEFSDTKRLLYLK